MILSVFLVFVSQLGEPIPFSSYTAVRADQEFQGDRIRRKMRKIIGRSILILATPMEKQAPNWHKAIW